MHCTQGCISSWQHEHQLSSRSAAPSLRRKLAIYNGSIIIRELGLDLKLGGLNLIMARSLAAVQLRYLPILVTVESEVSGVRKPGVGYVGPLFRVEINVAESKDEVEIMAVHAPVDSSGV